MKKNDIVTVEITDLTTEGHGIGKVDNLAVFVEGSLPLESVKAKIILLKKNYAVGKLEDIIIPSPSRIVPPCKYFKKCGGCSLQHLDYVAQLEYKQSYIKSCMERIAKLDVEVSFPLPSKNQYRYRNKCAFPVQLLDDSLNIGFYKSHSHIAIDIDDCKIQYESLKILMSQIRVWIISKQISVYDESTNSGLLRHVVVKTNSQGHMMLVLVINADAIPHESSLLSLLKFVMPKVKSIVLNINKEHSNVILGDKNIVIFGNDYIFETLSNLEFKITPTSFLQVNHHQTEVLYNNVFKLLNLSKEDIVVDLYCGIGTMTLAAAKQAKKVYGVEIVSTAIESANFNAQLNEIDNADFILGDVDAVLPRLVKKDKIDVIIVDPPRKGLTEKLIAVMVLANPQKIAYVSCNPATLARDLAMFNKEGYFSNIIQPIDMFPQTTHVECVVLMSRK